MQFKLFQKLASLEGLELWLLIAAAALFVVLLIAVLRYRKTAARQPAASKQNRTRTLVYGALMLTLSCVLSYFKLFSMPFGGSVTLVSMLCIYARYLH